MLLSPCCRRDKRVAQFGRDQDPLPAERPDHGLLLLRRAGGGAGHHAEGVRQRSQRYRLGLSRLSCPPGPGRGNLDAAGRKPGGHRGTGRPLADAGVDRRCSTAIRSISPPAAGGPRRRRPRGLAVAAVGAAVGAAAVHGGAPRLRHDIHALEDGD